MKFPAIVDERLAQSKLLYSRFGGFQGMDPSDFRSRLFALLVTPWHFFSSLKESSIEAPLVWYASGMFLVLFAGGPLSVILSAMAGVPVDKMVGYITGQEPGIQAFLHYALFLFLHWVTSIVTVMAMAGLSYLLSHALGADSSYVKSMGMAAYCWTPFYLAFALPQFLLIDTLTASPAISVVAMAWNDMVDFTQIASLAYVAFLAWIGCRRYYKLSVLKTWIFFAIPAGIAVFLLSGLLVLLAFLAPASA